MMSLYLSMAAFALAASISPGPVNLVSLSAGARHGLRVAMWHVAGATLGFTLLLVLIGLGLHQLLVLLPLADGGDPVGWCDLSAVSGLALGGR